MRHYRPHFEGKTVLCNCDDPFESNFFKFFAMSFRRLGIKALMADEEVQKKSGIYTYVLTSDEHALGLRTFTDNQKHEAYERQNGICPKCGDRFKLEEMDGDHIVPWSKQGKTTSDNCQMLCIRDNRSNR